MSAKITLTLYRIFLFNFNSYKINFWYLLVLSLQHFQIILVGYDKAITKVAQDSNCPVPVAYELVAWKNSASDFLRITSKFTVATCVFHKFNSHYLRSKIKTLTKMKDKRLTNLSRKKLSRLLKNSKGSR